jgi:hypothetical protein
VKIEDELLDYLGDLFLEHKESLKDMNFNDFVNHWLAGRHNERS